MTNRAAAKKTAPTLTIQEQIDRAIRGNRIEMTPSAAEVKAAHDAAISAAIEIAIASARR